MSILKQVSIYLLTIPFLFGVAGCSKKTESPERSDGRITLTLAAGAIGQELILCKTAAREYEKAHPNIRVEVLDTPNMATDRLGLYLQYFQSRSDTVDLYQIDVIWPGDLSDHFVDLNQYGARDYVEGHFDAIVRNNTVDGRLVAMPWFSDAGLLYYRKDLLEKYNREVPATWDDLEATAAIVQAGERQAGNPGFWGFVWQGNAYEGLTCNAMEWLASHGAGTAVDVSGRVTINSPEAVGALTRARRWIGTISPRGVLEFDEEKSRVVWQTGNALFMRNWPYAYSLSQKDGSRIKGKVGVAALPGTPGHPGGGTLGGAQLAVSNYSKHPEEAAKLLFFLTSRDQQKQRLLNGSFIPTVKDLYTDPEVKQALPYIDAVFNALSHAVPRPSTVTAPDYAACSKIIFQTVHDVLLGAMPPERAVKVMEADLNSTLDH